MNKIRRIAIFAASSIKMMGAANREKRIDSACELPYFDNIRFMNFRNFILSKLKTVLLAASYAKKKYSFPILHKWSPQENSSQSGFNYTNN